MRWSVDTAEVRSARKSRCLFSSCSLRARYQIERPERYGGGNDLLIMRAGDSYYYESACIVLANFYV